MEAVRPYAKPFGVDVRSALKLGTLVACWQIQSKLAAVTLLLLVAVSVWWALFVMVIWSVAATCAYYAARQRGLPDILAVADSTCSRAQRTSTTLGQVWLVGINAFAFARLFRPFLERTANSIPHRVSRVLVLLVGLTIFGVTISQHMLYHAGYRDGQLLGMAVLGAFLNVPFRIFCGAMTLWVVLDAMHADNLVPVLW